MQKTPDMNPSDSRSTNPAVHPEHRNDDNRPTYTQDIRIHIYCGMIIRTLLAMLSKPTTILDSFSFTAEMYRTLQFYIITYAKPPFLLHLVHILDVRTTHKQHWLHHPIARIHHISTTGIHAATSISFFEHLPKWRACTDLSIFIKKLTMLMQQGTTIQAQGRNLTFYNRRNTHTNTAKTIQRQKRPQTMRHTRTHFPTLQHLRHPLPACQYCGAPTTATCMECQHYTTKIITGIPIYTPLCVMCQIIHRVCKTCFHYVPPSMDEELATTADEFRLTINPQSYVYQDITQAYRPTMQQLFDIYLHRH